MVKTRLAILIRLFPALALFSCVPPKRATIVQEAPKKTQPEPEVAATEPNLPAPPDDGIRLPDLMAMPGDDEFKAAVPTPSLTNAQPGTVIARPPTDPPPRPKPKPGE